MWATLAAEVWVLTRPMYSSISLGLLPAAVTRVGWEMSVGMVRIPTFELQIQGRISLDHEG